MRSLHVRAVRAAVAQEARERNSTRRQAFKAAQRDPIDALAYE